MKQALSKVWEGWKKVALFIADILSRVILTIFYFTIFVPFGLGVTLFSDQLDMKDITPSWLERKTRDLTLDDAWRLW